jgi:large subunit ribosomal protein L25
MDFVTIEVKERAERGSAKVARQRRAGWIPGVLYGLGRPNLPLLVQDSELARFFRSGGRLVELRMADKTRAAILREVQVHPVSDEILHVDFVRVDKDAEVDDFVPIVFKGRAKGAAQGGVFQALTSEVHVRCRPLDLPKEIVYDVTPMELNTDLRAKDVPLPPSVKLLTNPDDLIAHVVAPKVAAPVAEAGAEGVAAAEPELIRKPAAATEEGEEPAKGGKAEKAEKPEKKGK